MALYDRVGNVNKRPPTIVPNLTVRTGKMPVEEAPLGLHYYVPTEHPVSRVEIKGMLQTLYDDGVHGLAGMRTSHLIPRSWTLWHLNDADRDDLFRLGYNPFVLMPGAGIVLYGNYIARSQTTLPDAIAIYELLYAISQIAQCTEGEVDDDMTFDIFVAIIDRVINEMVARRAFYGVHDGGPYVVRTGDSVDIMFQPLHQYRPMVMNIRRGHYHDWFCGQNLGTAIDTLAALYPSMFHELTHDIPYFFNESIRIIYARDQSGNEAPLYETRISP